MNYDYYHYYLGVCHSDDMMYLFPMDAAFPGQRSADDERMIDYLTTLWVNFARYG